MLPVPCGSKNSWNTNRSSGSQCLAERVVWQLASAVLVLAEEWWPIDGLGCSAPDPEDAEALGSIQRVGAVRYAAAGYQVAALAT